MNSKKIIFIALAFLVLVVIACSKSNGNGVKVTIFQDPSCGCCGLYGDYMRKNGFDVEVKLVTDLAPIKEQNGIPQNLLSCHTSLVDSYFVEGHVPAEAIQKLLSEKPDIKGISLPGMPSASPGMPGKKMAPFVIYYLKQDGSIGEFMRI